MVVLAVSESVSSASQEIHRQRVVREVGQTQRSNNRTRTEFDRQEPVERHVHQTGAEYERLRQPPRGPFGRAVVESRVVLNDAGHRHQTIAARDQRRTEVEPARPGQDARYERRSVVQPGRVEAVRVSRSVVRSQRADQFNSSNRGPAGSSRSYRVGICPGNP